MEFQHPANEVTNRGIIVQHQHPQDPPILSGIMLTPRISHPSHPRLSY
jgi:hypothetical protein